MSYMNAIVYSRVSTDVQERDGTSLDIQEGASLERPGMQNLRELLKTGEIDVVISYAVDRLSRSQNHIGVFFDEFELAGGRFEFGTERFEDTAVGRLILAARAFIAEMEREKIAERTMRGKAEPRPQRSAAPGHRHAIP